MTSVHLRLLSLLRTALGVGLLAYVLVATEGWRIGAYLLANPPLAMVLLGWTCLGTLVEAKRLSLLLTAQQIALPLTSAVRLVSIATFFNFFIPGGTGGDLTKLYSLAGSRPGRRIEIALIVLVDRAVGLFSLLSLITILAALNWQLVRTHVLLGPLVAMAVALLVLETCAVAFAWSARVRAAAVERALPVRLAGGRPLRRLWDAFYVFRTQRAALAMAVGVSLVGQVMLCGVFLTVAAFALAAAPSTEICLLSLLGMLANAVPLTPGGIGVGEAAFATLFASAGYSGGSQLIVAWRICALLVAIVGGVLLLAGPRRGANAGPTAPRTDRLHASGQPE